MKKLLHRKERFTAVMAFDDMTAFGAIRALTQLGLSVPERCSVVGFDGVAAAAHYNPPLSQRSASPWRNWEISECPASCTPCRRSQTTMEAGFTQFSAN